MTVEPNGVAHDPFAIDGCEAGDALALLDGVSRTYRSGAGDVEALKPLSLCVHRGDFLAVMGPSGSGKSTLLHVLGCLDKPTTGRYLLDGHDVARLADRELAAVRNAVIGFVFQRFHLLQDESARRNVELPLLYAGISRAERQRRASEALDSVGLAARATHRPNQMSGGEQQRVALARALVKRPRLLLADEPTGNLDSQAGAKVLQLIEDESRRGTTVVMITHDPEVAGRAEQTLVMRDGTLGRP